MAEEQKPLLMGKLVTGHNTWGNLFNLVMETRPCCWPSCKGKGTLYNASLFEKLMNCINYPLQYDIDNMYHGRFPELRAVINELSKTPEIMRNGRKFDKYHILEASYDDCGIKTAENSSDHVFNEIGEFSGIPDEFDQIRCDTCDNWYICCINCRVPCIIQGFDGDFVELVKSKLEGTDYDWGKSIQLARRVETYKGVDGEPDKTVEHITIMQNKEGVKIMDAYSGNPDVNIRDATAENRDDIFNSIKGPCYKMADKRIIWARDPRMNIHIDGAVFAPLHCGDSGGGYIEYKCDGCRIVESVTV
jgi:hypothetical protein